MKGKRAGNKGPASDIVLTQFLEPSRTKIKGKLPGTPTVKDDISHPEHV